MPPKPKFKREEIIAAAVDVTRESGIGAVSAREIAAHLGTSTRPIFTYFATMEELKQEIANTAEAILRRYVTDGLNTAIPFFGLGVNYIQFALDEPELYRLLYLTRVGPSNAMAAMEHVRALARDSIMRIYNMNERDADCYFGDLWLVVHGIATLIVTGECTYTDTERRAMLTRFSVSIGKALKEIPGFASGEFDRDAVFRALVDKQPE